jgi:hypothetical protein
MQVNPLVVPAPISGAALFLLGSAVERRLSSRASRVLLWIVGLILAAPGILFILYYTHLFDGAAWYYDLRILPYAELAASGLGFLGGVSHSWWAPEGLGEKAAAPAVVLVLVLVPFSKPIINPLDLGQLKDRFDGDACLQSTFSTCGPASAATLLRAFGKAATETELAKECFTSRGGTEVWYIARALKHRGFETKVLIQPPENIAMPSPAIAGVLLSGGAGHFIALVRQDPTSFTIADPMKGQFVISKNDLARQYHFTGFFLVLQTPRPVK